MDGSGTQYNPRTVEEVFRDFNGRRAGMIKALTDDVEDFFQQCDPEKENLCLYGFPSEQWEVNLPAEEVPPELPKPALGINFARDGMQEKDWLALVAVHSDAWLLAVAFYFSARFGFDRSDRKRLLNMINEMSTIYEVVTGAAKKQVKEKSSVSNHSSTKSKPNSKDTVEMNGSVLALTDNVVIPVSAVLNAIEEHGVKGIEQNDPLIITQALSLKQLPITSSSMDAVVFVLTTHELPGHELLEEMFRALKPGGAVTFQKSQSVAVNKDEIVSTLKRRLLLAGFLDAKVPLENLNSFTVRANKPSWKMGSSFTIKKSTKSLPKVQIDDDLDLIDEDSLLTEEDLKKPQLLPVDDCEVGSTRKACKNCSCGRAEAVEKVEKLGLTMDQIENPQSSCGSCGLGDAFRCGSCPYKGLPPFKLGEKVSLAGNFLASDF